MNFFYKSDHFPHLKKGLEIDLTREHGVGPVGQVCVRSAASRRQKLETTLYKAALSASFSVLGHTRRQDEHHEDTSLRKSNTRKNLRHSYQ